MIQHSKRLFSSDYSAFSGWIANLGVVPLLLFSAFLLLPILAFLLALLFLVTLVLETIFQLLPSTAYPTTGSFISWCKIAQFNKFHNLRLSPLLVKEALRFSAIFFMALSSGGTEASKNQKLIHTLAIGEIQKISTPLLEKFTLGNNETARVKALPKENSVLIKGKGLGQTDLLLWFQNRREPIKHQIFVVQKNRYRKLKSLSYQLDLLGLKNKIIGNMVNASGVINSPTTYHKLVRIVRDHEDSISLNQMILSPSLRLKIFSQWLERLNANGFFDLDCELKNIFIRCLGSTSVKRALKFLDQDFLIKWTPQKVISLAKQYQITLTLQQFENSTGEAFNLGLSKIEGTMGELLLENPLSIIHKNTIALKNSTFKSQTLARPQLKGRLNRPIKVRLGQEIPFLQSVAQGVATQDWRFAGLGIDLKISPHTDRLLLHYKTNLSRPGERGIDQNLQESEMIVALNRTHILFDIGFSLEQTSKEKLPLLSSIPLFGSLFLGENHGDTYKKILCLIHIEEIP